MSDDIEKLQVQVTPCDNDADRRAVLNRLAKRFLDVSQYDKSRTFARQALELAERRNDVLDFSRVEAGKLSLEHRPFALRERVENAVKFTARGTVTVHLEKEAERHGRVCIHCSVADTGIGIPKEKQTTIFDPFAQADGSVTRRHGTRVGHIGTPGCVDGWGNLGRKR